MKSRAFFFFFQNLEKLGGCFVFVALLTAFLASDVVAEELGQQQTATTAAQEENNFQFNPEVVEAATAHFLKKAHVLEELSFEGEKARDQDWVQRIMDLDQEASEKDLSASQLSALVGNYQDIEQEFLVHKTELEQGIQKLALRVPEEFRTQLFPITEAAWTVLAQKVFAYLEYQLALTAVRSKLSPYAEDLDHLKWVNRSSLKIPYYIMKGLTAIYRIQTDRWGNTFVNYKVEWPKGTEHDVWKPALLKLNPYVIMGAETSFLFRREVTRGSLILLYKYVAFNILNKSWRKVNYFLGLPYEPLDLMDYEKTKKGDNKSSKLSRIKSLQLMKESALQDKTLFDRIYLLGQIQEEFEKVVAELPLFSDAQYQKNLQDFLQLDEEAIEALNRDKKQKESLISQVFEMKLFEQQTDYSSVPESVARDDLLEIISDVMAAHELRQINLSMQSMAKDQGLNLTQEFSKNLYQLIYQQRTQYRDRLEKVLNRNKGFPWVHAGNYNEKLASLDREEKDHYISNLLKGSLKNANLDTDISPEEVPIIFKTLDSALPGYYQKIGGDLEDLNLVGTDLIKAKESLHKAGGILEAVQIYQDKLKSLAENKEYFASKDDDYIYKPNLGVSEEDNLERNQKYGASMKKRTALDLKVWEAIGQLYSLEKSRFERIEKKSSFSEGRVLATLFFNEENLGGHVVRRGGALGWIPLIGTKKQDTGQHIQKFLDSFRKNLVESRLKEHRILELKADYRGLGYEEELYKAIDHGLSRGMGFSELGQFVKKAFVLTRKNILESASKIANYQSLAEMHKFVLSSEVNAEVTRLFPEFQIVRQHYLDEYELGSRYDRYFSNPLHHGTEIYFRFLIGAMILDIASSRLALRKLPGRSSRSLPQGSIQYIHNSLSKAISPFLWGMIFSDLGIRQMKSFKENNWGFRYVMTPRGLQFKASEKIEENRVFYHSSLTGNDLVSKAYYQSLMSQDKAAVVEHYTHLFMDALIVGIAARGIKTGIQAKRHTSKRSAK